MVQSMGQWGCQYFTCFVFYSDTETSCILCTAAEYRVEYLYALLCRVGCVFEYSTTALYSIGSSPIAWTLTISGIVLDA